MVNPTRPLKVFLCHAHSDRSTVQKLYQSLIKDGVDVWLDKEKLLPGQDWEYEIREAVRQSDVVVVCLSTQFNQAGFRQKEVRLALDTAMNQPEGEIFIIPARLETCEAPKSLERWQWVDLFENDGYEKLMRALRVRANNIGAVASASTVARLVPADSPSFVAPEEGTPAKPGKPAERFESSSETFAEKHFDVYYRQADPVKLFEELIVIQSQEYISKGYSTDLLHRGLKKALEVVDENLRQMAIRVETKEEIASIVAVSAADENIGNLIADVMDKIGIDGVITVEESMSPQFETEYVEGMQFDRGYLSAYFVTDTKRLEAVISEPYILLCDGKVSAASDIVPILEKLIQSGKRDLVFIAEDIDGEALATLVLNKQRDVLTVMAVKAPGFGDRRKAMLQDMAALTGATVVSEETSYKLGNIGLQHLGRAEKVISDENNTTIVGGRGSKAAIMDRLKEIRTEIDKSTSDYDKEKLQERLAKLSGGVAIIRVGASTETKLKEKKRRVEDALATARAAIEAGFVPGNGVAYLHSIEALDQYKTNLRHEKIGISIIRNVLDAPIRRIAIGAGLDGTTVIENILKLSKEKSNPRIGYNMFTEEYADMVEAGIIEPAKKVTDSLTKAIDAVIARIST